MKLFTLKILIIPSLVILGCKGEPQKQKETEEIVESVKPTKETTTKTLEIELTPKSESTVSGKVTFTENEGLVTMEATLTGLTQGEHAIHIHQKSDCSSPDGKSTGGHWNPTMQPHGAWGASEGYHRGDIGNFKADEEGNANKTFATNEWCIGCKDEKKNILGKAIIVHQGIDDFTSQPSGAAGSRVSCGGIIQ